MPKRAKELSALEVGRLKSPGSYAVGGVSGLYLYVNDAEGRSWVLRTMIAGKRRHLGLGGYPSVTLAQAREKARAARDSVAKGIDPIREKQEAASALRAQEAHRKSFLDTANAYITSQAPAWKNAKHRAQWQSTLRTYAFPVIGHLPVGDITEVHVISVLEPIWTTKSETASRLRGRIESVLDWARVKGYREGENPARWKGHLDKIFPAQSQVRKVQHFRALPSNRTADFLRRLDNQEGVAALALKFLILTACRSGEVRGAAWREIDFENAVWTVPADRMKAKREHRVPLSTAALDLLNRVRGECTPSANVLIFSSPRGGMLSDMSLTAVMRRLDVDAVPHGFRSTFRDWVGELTQYPSDLAEMALAHTLANKTEAAYRRGDALEKRRSMMEDWARFCLT